MLSENLKNMSMNGDYQYNEEDESFSFDAEVKVLGSTIPIEMVGKGNERYLSTSLIDGTLTLMESFGMLTEVNQEQVNDLKGKYIWIDPEEMTSADDEGTPEPKKVRSKMNNLLKGVKKDSFKKDGETVSYTFTSKELEKLAKSIHLGEETEERLRNMTLTMKINKKTLKTDCTVKMQDSEQKMTMKAVITPSKKELAISMPKEQDIITVEDLDNLFEPQELSGVSGEFSQGEEEIEELTDKEFEMLYQQFEANMSDMPESDNAQIQELLSLYRPHLNDEQFARLEALLNQKLAV